MARFLKLKLTAGFTVRKNAPIKLRLKDKESIIVIIGKRLVLEIKNVTEIRNPKLFIRVVTYLIKISRLKCVLTVNSRGVSMTYWTENARGLNFFGVLEDQFQKEKDKKKFIESIKQWIKEKEIDIS